MAVGRFLLAVLMAVLSVPAAAEPIVVSPAPDAVSVTVYRDGRRSPNQRIDPQDEMLNGYALVTETRTVQLPPGKATIRFEGVASGIQPETALISGLDTREKNQDRRLLSQRALIDAFTGQRVIVRRTDRATGKIVEEPALIRSGANGAVLQTAAGFEALNCTGLAQTLVYPRVPSGVSAKPVLSVTTGDQPGGRRTLTLSYLTGNFDWQADYVAELSADGRTASLFAWVTLASRDDTTFPRARTNAVAGRLNRVERDDDDSEGEGEEGRYTVYARCWPQGTTGTPSEESPPPPPPPPPPAPMAMYESADAIVVTGSRVAKQETLGDLKLYHIPFPVTVAARSQKQVAFLLKPRVLGELLYRSDIGAWDTGEEPRLLYRIQNRKASGLGEPLPAGRVAMFQIVGSRRMLLGEASIDDKAVGEEVEFKLPEATNVTVDSDDVAEGRRWTERRLTVRNANPFPIQFEARFRDEADARFGDFGSRVVRVNGRSVWRVTVPANGQASLPYRREEVETED